MSLEPLYIAGSAAGLEQDKRSFLFHEQAYQQLNSAYVFRDRTIKREGLQLLGRLKRQFTASALGVSGASPWTFNIYATVVPPIIPEANAEIDFGSVIIVKGGITFTDQGDGTLTSITPGNSGIINYLTGNVTLIYTGAPAATTITFGYYPALPVMGILQRELATNDEDQTIFFDTKYAYINPTGGQDGFQEFIPGFTWTGSDAQFFSAANFTAAAGTKIFVVSNNNINDPIRYVSGVSPTPGAWVNLIPQLDSVPNFLFQSLILIPYYGRLLALNTLEGTAPGTAINYFNRCRFSIIGDPTSVDAWRVDIFGKGGYVDAPTNEAIVAATFFKNTLIVEFEFSKWQLRYVGQYGLPFVWERISSDFGTGSPYASILFDQGVRSIGDRAITETTSNNSIRIDQQIPNFVFDHLQYANEGLKRIHGVRDFQKELIFWSYNDSGISGVFNGKFPNRVLVNNYRNATYAIFRDNVTAFGIYQLPNNNAITWSSTTATWDSDTITWDDPPGEQGFPAIVSGNQEGFVHFYAATTFDEPSLSITGVILSAGLVSVTLTIVNHNLEDGETIYVTGLNFVDGTGVPLSTNLNEKLYNVTVINADTITLSFWTGVNYVTELFPAYQIPPVSTTTPAVGFTPVTTATYIGGGKVTLLPNIFIQTKDFNPYAKIGKQIFMSYMDFLLGVPEGLALTSPPSASACIQLWGNTGLSYQGNFSVGLQEAVTGNNQVATVPIFPYQPSGSKYLWHRFFATFAAQFISIVITYDPNLMNTLSTHQNSFELDAMTLWIRKSGNLNL